MRTRLRPALLALKGGPPTQKSMFNGNEYNLDNL